MLSFLRKKPDAKAAAARADWAIKKVYGYGAITLALTRIDTYWAFNKSTPLTIDTHVPFTHRLEPLKAYGVVDEIGQFDTRIMVDVEFTDYADRAGIGDCFLERKKSGHPTLRVILRDPGGSIGAVMTQALKEAAISGNSFQHFALTIAKSDNVDGVIRQIAAQEYGPSLTIMDMASVRKVLLPKAPPYTWRREWD